MQAYVVEFFDSRKAKQAREALDNRSIFGTSLRIISKHAADEILASAFADAPPMVSAQSQSTTMSPVSGRPSQPSSPLSAFSLSQYVADHQQHQQRDPYDEEFVEIDTTNSSPFHGPRALPLPISPIHAHMHQLHTSGCGSGGGGGAPHSQHVGGARRISTGSVKIPLHQSTSEQDLRRRAAAGAAAASSSATSSSYGTLLEALGLDRSGSAASAGGGVRYDPHMRRTSDTFDFESLRRSEAQRSGAESSLGMGLGLGLALPAGIGSDHGRGGDFDRGREDGRSHGGVRPLRTRAISESSASPRVVSPGEDTYSHSLARDRIVGIQPIDLQDAFEDFSSEVSGGHQQQYSGGTSTPDGSGSSTSHPSAGGDLFDSSEEIDLTRIHRRYASAADSSPVTGPQSPHTPHTPGDALAANSIFGSMHSPYSGWQSHQHQHQHQQAYSPHSHSVGGHHASMHGFSPQTDAHTHALLQAHLMGMPLSVVSPSHQTQHYYGLSPTSDVDPYAAPRLGDAYVHHGYGDGSSAFSPTASSGGRSATLHRHGQLTHRANLGATASSAGGSADSQLAERNQIDLDRIAKGLDTRTTVMIKNIPNKLTDKDLIEYISKVCPRKIDFLYLRMDFQNGELWFFCYYVFALFLTDEWATAGCNVGYGKYRVHY